MASREEKVHRWGADGEEIFIEVWKIWWTRITRRSKAARGCFLYQEQHSVQKEHYKADLKRIISSLDMVEKWAADDSNSFTQWFICNNSLNFVTFVTVATRINNVVLSQNGQTHIYLSPVDRVQYFQLLWRQSAFTEVLFWMMCPISMLGVLPQPFLMIVSIIFYWSVWV